MDEIKAKQQVVEKIKSSSKILVTVSNDPSVDALSAALGLALLLDKQEKYATAIFSGETPPAIAFLEPEKTFDDTTDSLRDFIIALNKEKADHLRYKVEGDAVKIFITPYKTTITEKDLDFSQGDYNVELVIALGVDNQDHLDHALENHGKILHDAAIVTMTSGDQTSTLGGTDWHDSNSSSLCEMVAGLAEALKEDKKKSLLDAPIATALLTGIVAETDRFSNEHTTSKSMTVAATLMSAGADQQLIANELQAAHTIEVVTPDDEPNDTDDSDDQEGGDIAADGTMTIKKDKATKDGLSISHDGETLADLDRRVRGEKKAKEKVTEEVEAVVEAAKEEAEEANVGAQNTAVQSQSAAVEPAVADVELRNETIEPVLGGTLNATAEQAAEDARREAENEQNKTLLSHSYLSDDTPTAPGSVAVSETEAPAVSDEAVHSAYAFDDAPSSQSPQPEAPAPQAPTAVEQPLLGGERVIQPLDAPEAPSAAPAQDAAAPSAPNPTPVDLGLPLPPPIPDFSQLNGAVPAPTPAIPLPQTPQPEILGDILAPEPAVDTTNTIPAPNSAYALDPMAPAVPGVDPAGLAPAVDTTVPPLPPMANAPQELHSAYQDPAVIPAPQPASQPAYAQPEPAPAPQPAPSDPGQFQIPGQQ